MPGATASSRRAPPAAPLKLLVPEGETVPEGSAFSASTPPTREIYEDGWVVR